MKRRLSNWAIHREERWLWVPRRLLAWAFDYAFDHGQPVEFASGPRPRVVVTYAHPLMEINPEPKTWGSS